MTKKLSNVDTLARIQKLIIDDIMAASDEEILKEAEEEYSDFRGETLRLYSLVQESINAHDKEKLEDMREENFTGLVQVGLKAKRNSGLNQNLSLPEEVINDSDSVCLLQDKVYASQPPFAGKRFCTATAFGASHSSDFPAGALFSGYAASNGACMPIIVMASIALPVNDSSVAEVNDSKSSTRTNDSFKRAVLAAEIVSRWCDQAKFGSVKLQKTLFLCEQHLGFKEVQGNYYRHAAGPHDNRMMRSVIKQLTTSKWFEVIKDRSRTIFKPLQKAGAHRTYFSRYWGDRERDFDVLIDKLTKMDTEQTEIIATIYAVWNDFLLSGKNPNDEEIVRDVLTNWHDSKRRIDDTRWLSALQWMKQNELVPSGGGSRTKSLPLDS